MTRDHFAYFLSRLGDALRRNKSYFVLVAVVAAVSLAVAVSVLVIPTLIARYCAPAGWLFVIVAGILLLALGDAFVHNHPSN